MLSQQDKLIHDLSKYITGVVSETNGVSLHDSLDLLISSELK
jgi:hypothetical protein